jgi:signal transduction histidine kinase
MRERVEAVGGALTVGNHLSGGFWVTATLPIGPNP